MPVRLLTAIGLLGLRLAHAVPLHGSVSSDDTPSMIARADPFQWANIGDSWSSGVAYSTSTLYDGNEDNCIRLIDAWPAQMAADNSWVSDGQAAAFKGCSGAQLVDMCDSRGNGGQFQLGKTGTPQVVVMSAGGNNAHFGDIVLKCLYTGKGPDWDDDFNNTSECKQAIGSLTAENGYLWSPDGDLSRTTLAKDLRFTLDDIFTGPRCTPYSQSHSEFWLYINLYVHFFNINATESAYCNDISFSPWWLRPKPLGRKAQLGMREAINSGVQLFNDIYRNVIDNYQPPDGAHVSYIDLSPSFQHQRFCEPENQDDKSQANSPGIWFWNLKYRNPSTDEDVDVPVTEEDGVFISQTPDGWDPVLDTSELHSEDDVATISSGGCNANPNQLGFMCRPFHPTSRGHQAIKDAVILRMRQDGLPGVAPLDDAAPTGPPGNPPPVGPPGHQGPNPN